MRQSHFCDKLYIVRFVLQMQMVSILNIQIHPVYAKKQKRAHFVTALNLTTLYFYILAHSLRYLNKKIEKIYFFVYHHFPGRL